MPNQTGKILLVIILVLLTSITATYFLLSTWRQGQTVNYSSQSLTYTQRAGTSGEYKDYYSKNLKISFKIPADARVEESFTNIKIGLGDDLISINFNGTNFENVKDHYEYLKEKNHLAPISYQQGSFHGYDYILITDKTAGSKHEEEKSYLIYADYGIYIFSTSDSALYPVLDRIVESFEYKSNK